MNPALFIDGYKTSHANMYPDGTQYIYSNFTARKSRIPGVDHIIFFGLQYFIKEYLIDKWNNEFFKQPKSKIEQELKIALKNFCDEDIINRLLQLHGLGYLPITIKAVNEGQRVPIGVPCLTIINTHPRFFWLTNFLETILSNVLWQPCTSATIANRFYLLLKEAAETTDAGNVGFAKFQGHDFSMRGMSSLETACLSGAAHLLSFLGTDTIPATLFLAKYYKADLENDLVGCSVPASEHSVMSAGGEDLSDELNTFKRLITEKFPTGILSIVSDTWNIWAVTQDILPALKNEIIDRNGKIVIRPDSSRTSPQDIICGMDPHLRTWSYNNPSWDEAEEKGLVECLWDTFGGQVNSQGYKVLHPSIGGIYGDAISYDRLVEICSRLKEKGFASTNMVYGIGSYTYQFNTRDTFGFAMKATWCCKNSISYNMFKNPITDAGEKKSAVGLLRVGRDDNNKLYLIDKADQLLENGGELQRVFCNGQLLKEHSLSEIRERISNG